MHKNNWGIAYYSWIVEPQKKKERKKKEELRSVIGKQP
jgi:hypothetical protein